jgi:phospholipid/cholesterol/gamma-HCH transport system substrate-binding protein
MRDEGRKTDVRVGLFVLAALVILVVGSLWIAGSRVLAPQRQTYSVLMKDSGGIQAGTRVRVAGVAVGKIHDVDLRPEDEWPVVFRVAINSRISIHTDGEARITSSGLLGNAFLQIDPGTPTEPLLEPGGEIYGRAGQGFENAMAQVEEMGGKVIVLLDQASALLDQLSGELGPILEQAQALLSEENAAHVGSLLASMDETMTDAGPRLTTLLTRLESVADSADNGLERMPELAAKLDSLVDDLQTAMGPEGSRLSGLLDTAQHSLSSADDAMSILGDNREELEAAMRDLRETAANLKAFSQTVKERPYSLVRVKAEPERKPGEGVK